MSEEAIAELKQLLAGPKGVVCTTHFNPDGDAMGSTLGLVQALRKLGHDAHAVLPNIPPGFLQWMPGYAQAVAADKDIERAEELLLASDVLFCLDHNTPDRVGPLQQALERHPLKVMVDHHQDPSDMATIMFSDTASGSTAQLVFDLLVALGAKHVIDTEIATCLYTGIMTDSGSFRFGSTTAHTHRVAAELLESGVRPDQVYNAVMDNSSEQRLRLLGHALSNRLDVIPDLGVAIMALSAQELKDHGFKLGDTEGFVNYGLGIRNIRLSALFMEAGEIVKISLRSIGDLPVDLLARTHFLGGGHRNAAGGRSEESLDATIERFRSLLPDFLNEHGP
ncbi:MAG: bifunctional oligoribonuclease/PAP phosphatase NrnA [Flavobacteriales bacterium]|nr:bifunctional oligoribonuclease/PAP phosphatase NrnA [Flavobacteriales bacterium]